MGNPRPLYMGAKLGTEDAPTWSCRRPMARENPEWRDGALESIPWAASHELRHLSMVEALQVRGGVEEDTDAIHIPKEERIGEKATGAKLTEAMVHEIRHRYATEPVSYEELSKEYPVSSTGIRNAILRVSWSHI